MTYKAIKVVIIGDKTFNPGDTVPSELVEPRHIRSKKIEAVNGKSIEDKRAEAIKVEKEIIEKSEEKEEILTENSADIEVTAEEAK